MDTCGELDDTPKESDISLTQARNVLSESANPINSSGSDHNSIAYDDKHNKDYLKAFSFKQLPPPLTKIPMSMFHFVGKLVMCGTKVVRYESKHLAVYRALVATQYSLLSNRGTWIHLFFLLSVAVITFGLVEYTGQGKSIGDMSQYSVTERTQVLLTFVLAGYVGQSISRWTAMRQRLGTCWGALENINQCATRLFSGDSEYETEMKEKIIRYNRCVFLLFFLAAQQNDSLSSLYSKGILTEEEGAIVSKSVITSRHHVVIGWIASIFDTAAEKGFHDFIINSFVTELLTIARSGASGTLGMVNCPLPYMYTHLVYWVLEFLLVVLAVESGISCAIMSNRRENGDEGYTPSDPNEHWPMNEYTWFGNFVLQQIVGNCIFIIFTEGLLKMCDKIENPLSTSYLSFPEENYQTSIHNNSRAFAGGYRTFRMLSDFAKFFPAKSSNGPVSSASDVNGFSQSMERATQASMVNSACNSAIPRFYSAQVPVEIASSKGFVSSSQSWADRSGFASYTSRQLAAFMRAHDDISISSYANAFETRGVNGRVLLSLTDLELREEFNVTDKIHRMALMSMAPYS